MDISALQSRLPAIRKWIDTTVEGASACGATADLAGVFSPHAHYFDADTLRRASVVEVDVVPKPPLTALGLHQFSEFEQMNAAGTTYGDLYFVDRTADTAMSRCTSTSSCTPSSGTSSAPIASCWRMRSDHLAGGYENNPLEEVAHALEGIFAREPRLFRVEPIISQHLDTASCRH